MSDLTVNTLDSNIITSRASDYMQSVTNSCTEIYNPYLIPYNSDNYTITLAFPIKLKTDSNELKINIKKFQIKFNFNL